MATQAIQAPHNNLFQEHSLIDLQSNPFLNQPSVGRSAGIASAVSRSGSKGDCQALAIWYWCHHCHWYLPQPTINMPLANPDPCSYAPPQHPRSWRCSSTGARGRCPKLPANYHRSNLSLDGTQVPSVQDLGKTGLLVPLLFQPKPQLQTTNKKQQEHVLKLFHQLQA